jgi:4-carboxymuconolactone decarboxylase
VATEEARTSRLVLRAFVEWDELALVALWNDPGESHSLIPGRARMSEEAYRDGLEVKRRLFGAGKERPVQHGSLADELLRLSDEMVFGRIYTRPGLDLRTRSMLTVAALTVLGRDDYLRRHLQGALHVGVTPAELKEILMQMAFYGGMPVALKALRIAGEEIAAWEKSSAAPGGRA